MAQVDLQSDLKAVSSELNPVKKFAKLKKLGERIKNLNKAKNIKIISDSVLKNNGIDAHQLKYDWLGKKAPISKYDLYKDNKTGEVLIFLKGGKGYPINTGEFIK